MRSRVENHAGSMTLGDIWRVMLLASQRGTPDIRFAIVHSCTSENRCREALRPVTLIDPCFRQWQPSPLAVRPGSCMLMLRLQ